MGGDGSSGGGLVDRRGAGLSPLLSVLRLAALALLVVGFVGFATNDATFAWDAWYVIVFAAGLVCAMTFIYLGLLGQGNVADE